MPTYLDLVWDGAYIGRAPTFGVEVWRYKEDIFLAKPDISLVMGPLWAEFLFV